MYRSHDGYKEDDTGYLAGVPGSNYADQTLVFNELGQGVLDNAFAGQSHAIISVLWLFNTRNIRN